MFEEILMWIGFLIYLWSEANMLGRVVWALALSSDWKRYTYVVTVKGFQLQAIEICLILV